MGPSAGNVVVAIVTVIVACLAGTVSIELARRSRNWLHYLTVAGCGLLVAGIVGQRVFPNDDETRQLGAVVASQLSPGPWDAGLQVPLTSLQITPVAVVGLVVIAVGAALVLFFPDAARGPVPQRGSRERLEQEDRP